MFTQVRLKLTGWYLLIIMLVSISFSVVIYRVSIGEVERISRMQNARFERQIKNRGMMIVNPDFRGEIPPMFDPDIVEETRTRLAFMLILVNGGILILSSGLGYFLAGKTLNPIKEMMDEQSRFITDSSHELRTPLTALKSTMEVSLRDKNLTIEEARELIEDSIGEVNKLQALSDGLLQLSQYQQPLGMKLEKVELQPILKEVVQKLTPIAEQKQIKIQSHLENITLQADSQSLNDLVIILLENAIKYSPEKTEIVISSEQKKNWAKITVQDQGIGIGEQDLPHIFERFYRADSARSKPNGYGLGLSIAKRIVDIHHGKITVNSRGNHEGYPDKTGTTFLVRLPIKQPAI